MFKKNIILLFIFALLFCQKSKKDTLARDFILLSILSQPNFAPAPYSKYLYTVNRGSNDIYAYKVDPYTGGLTTLNITQTDSSPSSLAINFTGSKKDADGLFAYVANYGSNSVSGYSINKSTGEITPISGDENNTTVANNVGTHPTSLVFDPTGQYLLVANSGSDNVRVFTFDSGNGTITPAATTSLVGVDANSDPGNSSTNANDDASPIAVMFHPTTSRIVYTVNHKANTISTFNFNLVNPTAPLSLDTTKEITVTPAGQTATAPRDLVFEPNGRFAYVLNQRDNSLSFFVVDLSPSITNLGKLSPVDITTPAVPLEGTLATSNPQPLTQENLTKVAPYKGVVDPTGRFLYILYYAAKKVALFHLDSFTGMPSYITSYDTGSNPSSLALDQSGRYLYVCNAGSNTISIYSVNLSNGRLSGSGTVDTGIQPIDIKLY